VDYFEGAIKNSLAEPELRIDLSKLYMRLKQYTNANNVLQEAISIEETNSNNIENMRRIVELYSLMGKV
jgi:outer membrane protein assembly factor BamD (BamD/ComL family)